ncbi:integration host factor subunit beta [Methylobacterium sp. BE186]|nr:integration host factor subunit beta [Methylobacterium sp. BE186]
MNAILGRLEHALAAGDRAEIRGFGAFSTKNMRARQGRNPRTGASVVVTEKRALHFRPGKEIRQRLNPAMSNDVPELRRVG